MSVPEVSLADRAPGLCAQGIRILGYGTLWCSCGASPCEYAVPSVTVLYRNYGELTYIKNHKTSWPIECTVTITLTTQHADYS